MIVLRILAPLKWLVLAGVFVCAITDAALLGMFSSLGLIAAQLLIFLCVWITTGKIIQLSTNPAVPEGIRAEAATLRRLVLPRAYSVLILAAFLLTLHITSPTPRLAAWFIPGLAIITTLAGIYASVAEFFAYRLLAALQHRLAAMLAAI